MLYSRAAAVTTAVAAALVTLAGSGLAAAPAFASSAHQYYVYYVNNTVSACTDTGSGTSAAPFCTIQAAFDKVSYGDTVEVVAGTYTSPSTLTTSGVAGEPITLKFPESGDQCVGGAVASITLPAGSSRAALTISNAEYVDLDDPCVSSAGATGAAVALQNSSWVVVDGGYLYDEGDGIDISGSSVGDTVEKVFVTSPDVGVAVSSGTVDATISTNKITTAAVNVNSGAAGSGITVTGASDTDIVSNTVVPECIAGVSVTGGSSSTTFENNVITAPGGADQLCGTAEPTGLVVSADSASEITEDYDSIGMYDGVPVEWAGTVYKSASTFKSATGQGTHDYLGSDDLAYGDNAQDYADAADTAADGEQSTDILGDARVDDPYVTNTGSGVGYYDRGATELQAAVHAAFANVTTVGGHGITVDTEQLAPCGGWGTTYTATLSWGDGQTTTQSGKSCNDESLTATHTYASAGTHGLTLSVTNGYSTVSATQSGSTAGLDYTSYGPTRILDTRYGTGATKAKVASGKYVKVKVAGNGSIPANAQAVAVNLTATNITGSGYLAAVADGAGTPSTSNLDFVSGQTVASSAIVTVAADGYIDIYNGSKTSSIDVIADVTGYFTPTASAGYATVTPARILDTRSGTGAPKAQVASKAKISVGIVGVDAIPASATAVAVHVTVTNASGGGFIAAVPDGSSTPTTSSLNFGKGQTISNTVIVPIAADGKIELYNGGTGPVDLIADVAGYLSKSSTVVYLPQTPTRVLNTITGSGALKSDTAYYYVIAPSSFSGIVAVVTSLTATQPTAGGNLQAYPAGVNKPGVSNVNFGTGQTVANLALLTNGESSGADTEIYNASPGTTQVIIDSFGYFTAN